MSDNNKIDEDKTQPNLLRKFTDAPSALVELVILILEKIGINIPESARNEIGIILLLVTIFASGDLFKISATIPMILFAAIVLYTVVDVLSVNSQKISRFMRGKTRAESIIKKIKDGTLPNAAKEISLATFDAESLDNLLIELSKEGLLTYDIQSAILNTQRLYPKNLRTLFNKGSNINLHEDIVSRILSFNSIKGLLTVEQIEQIIYKYKNNNRIITVLLLNQPLSLRIVETLKDDNLNKIYLNCRRYHEKPFLLDKYFNAIETILKLSLAFFYLVIFVALVESATQTKTQTSPDSLVFSIIIFAFFFLGIFLNIHLNIKKRFMIYLMNRKVEKILTMIPLSQQDFNKKTISFPYSE